MLDLTKNTTVLRPTPDQINKKGGSSELNTSYQLRLQTYFSLINNTPLNLVTSPPVNPGFQQYLDFWGVNVAPPAK